LGRRRGLWILLALLPALAPAGQARADLAGHGGPVRALAATDGGLVASAGLDTGLMVWAPAAGEAAAARLLGHEAAVGGVALAADGSRAVSVGDDGLAIGWDVAGRREAWRVRVGARLAAAALSPDGGLAAAAGWDGTVRLLRAADGAEVAALDLGGAGEWATGVAFADAGAVVAAAGHLGTVRAWRVADGALVREWRWQGLGATALASDGAGLVATAGPDRVVRLWDLAGGERPRELAGGHERPVAALAFSRDGRWLASGAADGQVVLWDVAAGAAAAVLRAEGAGPVWALAFGRGELYAGGADGVVRRWSVPGGERLGAAAAGAPPATEGGRGRGEALFRKCAACHTLTADGGNRAGPSLLGVLGRRAGGLPGYAYSGALAASGVVWTEEAVGRLLEVGPDVLTPGSKMPLQRVPDPADRAALVAHLKAAAAAAAPP
jgi:cytochrome c